jgi:predicted DNA-binding transcriptional regulator AlpA
MRRDDSEAADDADQVVDAGPRLAVVKRERAPADAAPPQPVSIDGDTCVDRPTLAEILGCSRVTLQQARTRGEGIPYVKIGRLVRYSTRTVREWLATRTRGSLPPGSAGANKTKESETKESDGRSRRG